MNKIENNEAEILNQRAKAEWQHQAMTLDATHFE